MDFDPAVVGVALFHLRSRRGQLGVLAQRAARCDNLDDLIKKAFTSALRPFSRFSGAAQAICRRPG